VEQQVERAAGHHDAPTDDAADFARLEELESRAFTYAMVAT